MTGFDGLGMSLGNLPRLSNAKTRSICPENFTGQKGKGGMSADGPGAQAARDLPFPEGFRSLAGGAAFLFMHEAYHLGQIGLLRVAAGREGFA